MAWETRCELIKGKTEEESIPICLECPYPECLDKDNREWIRRKPRRYAERNARIVEFSRDMTINELSQTFGLNRRTIWHILKECKE